jgi:hypothetical protein
VTAGELIAKAAACKKCGKEHQYHWIGERRASWMSLEDGHNYDPVLDTGGVAMLRYLATGQYENPWTPKDPPKGGTAASGDCLAVSRVCPERDQLLSAGPGTGDEGGAAAPLAPARACKTQLARYGAEPQAVPPDSGSPIRGVMFFRKVLSVAALSALAGCGSSVVTSSPATSAPEVSTSSTLPPVTGLHRVHDPGQVTGTITGTCHVRGQLPDPGCTPGAIDPAVTQADIGTTICVSGYTKTVRPPEAQTEAFKFHVAYPAYGIPAGGKTELDHLVSLELGGANDASNLWPETPPVPNPKDSVENALHAAVCAHKVTLAAAQLAIARNWMTAETVLGLSA